MMQVYVYQGVLVAAGCLMAVFMFAFSQTLSKQDFLEHTWSVPFFIYFLCMFLCAADRVLLHKGATDIEVRVST